MGDHEVAHEVQALLELAARPAGQIAIEPAHAGRVGDDTVLALHAVFAAPLAELAHEGVGDFPRSLLPRFPILRAVGPDLGELRHCEVRQVDQARGVVDDQRHGHARLGIEHTHALGRRGPVARLLTEKSTSPAVEPCGRRADRRAGKESSP